MDCRWNALPGSLQLCCVGSDELLHKALNRQFLVQAREMCNGAVRSPLPKTPLIGLQTSEGKIAR
eukprot:11477009-Prorocentrum_lima.AAC.1